MPALMTPSMTGLSWLPANRAFKRAEEVVVHSLGMLFRCAAATVASMRIAGFVPPPLIGCACHRQPERLYTPRKL